MATSALKYAARQARGQCATCNNSARQGHSRCETCQTRNTANTLQRRKARLLAGQCTRCGTPATASEFCFDCWLKALAFNTTRTTCFYAELKARLEAQQYRCAYTGETLIPGVNASIDHLIPRSRGGSNTPENLHWVSFRINVMKGDMTHDEFLAACALITARVTH